MLLISAWSFTGCSSSVEPASDFLAWFPSEGDAAPGHSAPRIESIVTANGLMYASGRSDTLVPGKMTPRDSGSLYASRDFGRSWWCIATHPFVALTTLTATPNHELLAVETLVRSSGETLGSRILRSADGREWRDEVCGLPTSAAHVIDGVIDTVTVATTGTLYLLVTKSSSAQAALYQSTDDGRNWKQINTGAENAAIRSIATRAGGGFVLATGAGVFVADEQSGVCRAASDGLPTASGEPVLVHRMAVVSNETFIAQVEYPDRENHWGTFRTTDAGTTWSEASAGLPAYDWTYLSVASGSVFACESMSAYRTETAGSSWRLVCQQSCAKPEAPTVYVVGPDGHFIGGGHGIFRSSYALN